MLARLLVLALIALPHFAFAAASATSVAKTIAAVQPKMVKIHGSGGLRGLEAYQTGFLISAEGHVLTVWSYVLDDPDYITVTLNDGRKFTGDKVKFLGSDPRLEIAVLKIDATELPHFNLDQPAELEAGTPVLAFSNLYGVATGNEPASVQYGSVTAKTNLAARRGAFKTTYNGVVYVVDAMTNNPGAAGGALTDRRGQLAGLLGKELRNAFDNTWLNYAIPISSLRNSIDDILAGKSRPRVADEMAKKPLKPWSLSLMGLILVPDVLTKTPPFVDRILPDSPAAKAGLRSDDLVLFVNNRIAASCKALAEELSFIDRIDPVRLTVQRGQELVDLEVKLSDK